MGKKKGRKTEGGGGDGQQQGGSQQQQRQQGQRGPPQQQQRDPQQQQQRDPQQQQQRGPPQQQQRDPQQQQQRGPPQQQQQRGPPQQQQQRDPQQQQQRGPPQQQQRGPPQQQQRGPPQQQQQRDLQQQQQQQQQQQSYSPAPKWGPPQQQLPQQQQRGPQLQQPQQQQRGSQQQQQQQQPYPSTLQWGPPQQRGSQQQQSQQQQRGPEQQQPQLQQGGLPQQQQGDPQQQGGPPQQQQRGPPQQQQQRGPQQEQQRGPPQQQQRGPPQQQQQRGPPQQQQQRGPQQQQRGAQQQQSQQQQPQPQQRGPPQQQQKKDPQQQQQQKKGPPQQQKLPAQEKPHSTDVGGGGGDTGLVQPKIKHKPGKEGRIIKIETNHLALNLGKLKTAIHYDVDINPDTPKKLLPLVMEMFRQKYYKTRYPAFDGKKNLYASSVLFNGDAIEGEVEIIEDDRKRPYKVKVQFANYVDLSPLQDMLNIETSPTEALQCVDIVLRSAPATFCIPVGRNFFIKPPGIIDLGEGMQMYHGFYQSAIRGWKPLLNVDVAHKAFPKDTDVLNALVEVCSSRYQQVSLDRALHPNDVTKFEKYMRTLKVIYEIPGNPTSKRAYRCNGLGQTAGQAQFTLENGTRLTVQQYFERSKNYRLRYPHLPTLWVGSKQRQEKMLLPMELCKIAEGQAVQRKMTEEQTRNMIRYSATSTDVRKEKIMRAIDTANYNASPTVREFNFSVGSTFEKLDARVLTPPAIQYGNGQVRVARGEWRNDRNVYVTGAVINKWTVVCADRDCKEMDNFARMIQNQGNSCGMQIGPPIKPFQKIGGRQQMADILQFFQRVSDYDVIFVVVPGSGPQYGYVKKAAELRVGCLTQCVKSNTLMRRLNAQTVANILLKVNSKMNGRNHHTVERPLIMNRPCMIMGADVTHPGPDSTDIPSVAAVTASHDPKAFCYNICYRLQSPKLEIIDDLSAIVQEQLHFFYKKTNGHKPERIVFFRDGVSEGQFKIVRDTEIRAIRNACMKMGDGEYQPKVTFLVVQKRHHTRMFPLNKRDSEDRNCNVPAGTCVDHTINNPFMQDFYLVSHASIQGVAKPTKYCTLWDENDLSYDQIQQLSYFLCHMFTRCNRSVSYPAPTYYAHLAAARAKVYIENENLNMNRLREEQDRYNILAAIQKEKPMFFV